jgi:amidophosphoribosyltransferase
MCGIVGICHPNQSESETPSEYFASAEVYQALLMLQHRGQDSAGILSVDSNTGKFHLHKELGQVSHAFDAKSLKRLEGSSAIGHTRYSTIGDIKEADLQPMAVSLPIGIGLVHNGNVSNYDELRNQLISKRNMFMSDNDLEIMLQMMAAKFVDSANNSTSDNFQNLIRATTEVLERVEGGYSVVGLLGGDGMFAFRDPHGIRPLVLGKREQVIHDKPTGNFSFCLTSETCALKFLGFEYVRDVKPGELIWIPEKGEFRSIQLTNKTALPCMFEWVYFSSADSTLEKHNVYQVRLDLGRLLGKRIEMDRTLPKFDVVAPVPDTSRPSAIALAEQLSVPFRELLIKNRYVQRSFIMNGQDKRSLAVGMKFAVVDELVRGKNVLLVDDSIVRGTTSKKLIALLKDRGAKSVYLASSCPPIVYPCYYGIDFPTRKELIAAHHNAAEVALELGANGVFYSTMQDLKEALTGNSFCHACLNGEYAYPVRQAPHPSVHLNVKETTHP